MTDWTEYRACGICRAEPGKPCTARYTHVIDGAPDGPPVELGHAHGFRRRKSGR